MRLFLSVSIAVCFMSLSLQTPVAARAQSFSITCAADACAMEPENAPLFQETNMLPGETRYGTFIIYNEQKKEGCQLSLRAERQTPLTTPDLAEQLSIVLSDAYWVYLDQVTFDTLFSASDSYEIGIVDAQTSSLYSWETTFAETAENQLQGSSFSYDFDIAIVCDKTIKAPKPPKTPRPDKTPKPTKRPKSTSESTVQLDGIAQQTEPPTQEQGILTSSLAQRLGTVLGIATDSASESESAQKGAATSGDRFALIPQELQRLSDTTKYLLLILYILLCCVILSLVYVLLFRQKRTPNT